jgi:hypothetical protein
MGKWCEVKCNCENREPVYSSEKYKDYKCGHKGGIYIEFAPNDLFRVGLALKEAFDEELQPFEVFTKIPNWRIYDDEYLALTDHETDLWEVEIQELQKFINGEKFMGWDETRRFHNSLEENQLLLVLFENYSPKDALEETLEDSISLIEASKITGNSIEFFW